VKHPLKGNIGAATVKLFLNARFPAVKLRLNREPVNVLAVVCFLKIISTAEKCIGAVPSVKKSRDCPSSNAAFVTIGSTVQPVVKKFLPIPF